MSQKTNWKDGAIQKSGLISDVWDIFISYAGRAAGWILFSCMAVNIIQVLPGITIPAGITTAVTGIEIITLDVAGFGLNTIAKLVKKHGDDEQRKVAKGANRLASMLIGIMMLTLILITLGYLFPTLTTATKYADDVLIVVRIALIVYYMHTMHALREAESEIATKETQTEQANDKLALSNQKQIEASDKKINTVYGLLENIQEAYTKQSDHIQKLEEYVQRLENHIQNSAQTIDTVIDSRINELTSSVTEIHNNVLQITQNNQYNVSPPPLARDERDGYSVEDVTTLPALIESPKSVAIPALEVAGMTPEKITEVLTFFLSGTSWSKTAKDLNLNYSRDVKPIKEAYERSLEESVHTL